MTSIHLMSNHRYACPLIIQALDTSEIPSFSTFASKYISLFFIHAPVSSRLCLRVTYRSKRYPIGQWFTNAFPASWQVSISLHKIYMHMICDVQYTYDILRFSPFLGYTHRSSFHQTSWMSRFFPRFPINTFPFYLRARSEFAGEIRSFADLIQRSTCYIGVCRSSGGGVLKVPKWQPVLAG